MPAAAHPYFMFILDRIQWGLKKIAGHWSPFHRRIKRSPVSWALDYKVWLSKVTLELAEPYSAPTCVSNHIDLALCDSDYRINFSILHLMTKWLQTHCNCQTVRPFSIVAIPTKSILQCVELACFTLAVATRGKGGILIPACAHHALLIRSTKVRTRDWFLSKGWLGKWNLLPFYLLYNKT